MIELERILKVEEKYPDAHGYFLLTVEENDLAGRKYKVNICRFEVFFNYWLLLVVL